MQGLEQNPKYLIHVPNIYLFCVAGWSSDVHSEMEIRALGPLLGTVWGIDTYGREEKEEGLDRERS